MDTHFCTCINENCTKHPRNHDKGCDGCIQANLKAGAIPLCFYVAVSKEDAPKVTEFTYKGFADFVKNHEK